MVVNLNQCGDCEDGDKWMSMRYILKLKLILPDDGLEDR